MLDIIEPSNKEAFEEVYIVLEYCESDLKKLIKSSLTLELIHIQTIVWNLLHAVKYMHDSKVLHRDLKPANVLLNEDCTVKVCDFGLARYLPQEDHKTQLTRQVGSWYFMAPELFILPTITI